MNPAERKKTVRKIAVFSLLVTALAFISPLLGGSPTAPGVGFIIWGTAPMLVAILIRLLTRDWSDAGLRPAIRKNARWYIISALAYPVVMTLTLLIGAITSITSVSGFSMMAYLTTALTALPIFFVFAIFEEFGWRGYLVPKLAAIGINKYLMHVIVAVVWATWHLPFIQELTWLYTSEELATFIPRLYLGAFAFSLLYDEIRIITGTFWPAVLLHAISNSFGHPLAADYETIATGKAYLGSIGFDGLLMMAFFAVSGIALNRWRTGITAVSHSFT
ncbi:MAG: CPBP family intramembrane metalloprotease [Anaerolineaceae bacterium]|nr:CPBP family intramembrane metalloprotease [Anaerolineaceae bacterium]